MRELKFRAWHKAERRFLSASGKRWCISPHGRFCWWNDSGGWQESDECEVLMYTGLMDAHMKEIYEGDILMAFGYTLGERDTFKSTWLVVWNPHYNGGFSKKRGDVYLPLATAIEENDEEEIIGNQYENPGLLQT